MRQAAAATVQPPLTQAAGSLLLTHSACALTQPTLPNLAVVVCAAAGGSVEPFWSLYQQHQKPEIRDILSKYRVGTLKGAPKQSAVPQVSAGLESAW